jgi:hypothetical protein
MSARAVNIITGPNEAALRAAIAAAQDGDTVTLTNYLDISAPLRIAKRITLRSSLTNDGGGFIGGYFNGELLQIATNGIVLEWIRFYGSPQTDGLRLQGDVTLRDCILQNMRRPVVFDWAGYQLPRLSMERVLVTQCFSDLECPRLDAKDSTFAENRASAANIHEAHLLRCKFERNGIHGLQLSYGSIHDCVFRSNGGFGLRHDPDPGVLNMSGSLFYANGEGGAFLGEQATVTVDNCTFTRHTDSPAIVVDQADGVLLRHCTVVDNFIIFPRPFPWDPWTAALFISSGPVTLQNCLVAENPTSEDSGASGLHGNWIDGGGNVIGGVAGVGLLRDNGGPTLTMLPLPGSPAIDAGVASELVIDARHLSRVAGAAPDAGAAEAGAATPADTDGDGLPNLWETFHSLNATNATDAASDTDADGATALAEFRAGTDPGNAQSVMRTEEFTSFLELGRQVVQFKWRFVPGVTWRVESSTDLQQWRLAPGGVRLEYIQHSIVALQFTTLPDSPVTFYRLTVVKDPTD